MRAARRVGAPPLASSRAPTVGSLPSIRLLLPVAIAVAIWVLSSRSDPGPDLGGLQGAASYVAHFTIYAALWTSLAWALGWRRPLLAFIATVAYGAVDELHQSFVPGRDASPVDLAVDALGAGLAWAAAARLRGRLRRDDVAPPAPAGTPTGQHSR